MKMKNHSNWMILLFCLQVLPATLHGQWPLVVQHSGANDPTTEGFFGGATYGAPEFAPVTNDLGRDAWSTRISAAGVNYTRSLPNFTGLDWELSVGIRIVENSLASFRFVTSVATDESLFAVYFGSDTNGDPNVSVVGSSLSPIFVLTGASSTYHDYQLRYDASVGTADLWVDGVELISDISAYISGAPGNSPSFGFGGGYQNVAELQANWNLVRLEIIPEPSSLVLLCCGGALFAGCWLARRLKYNANSSK